MIGEQLGGYTIRSELGSGGMGKVYLAENGRRCALKLLHPHLLDSTEAVDRFKLEAELGRRVEHENVVRTFDVGSADVDGVTHHYLVMDYVEGQTLRALLHDVGRVPEELCRHIGREVAHGLAAIHETGVVHRDIKPENVLITKDHVVKVMDLGVAKLLDEAIKLSQTGAFQGSLLYAAPEQFSGATPDPRADFYSLGLVLYELATGRHPFAADSTAEVLARLLSEDPRPAAELNPQLSPFFEEVCKALLQKDRERRIAFLPDGEESAWWRERALAIRLETRRPLRRIRIPRETELYGREHDLAQLHGLWEHVKAGNGRVLLVEGEAGIGKTRFIDELVARLRQDGEDLNFLFGSYPPGGAATAAGAFSTAYGEHFGYEGLEETLARCLTTTPVLVPAFAALLAGDVVRAGAQPLNKDAFQTCFVNATRALADERPTIVLIDDLHFAPEEGRALFTALALAIPGQRVLLVGNRRPGVDEDWVAGLTRLEQTTSLALARLGPKDLVRLLEDTLRSKRLAADLASQIAVKSDGNPFFVFEILRGLREEKFLTQKPDGTWVTTQIIENIQIPSSVLDLVNAHVAALDDDERNLLEVAACCGYEFDPTLVGNVLGIPTIPTLQSFGRIEKTHRLVRSAGRRLVFDHHQVQEALYAGILEQLREEYHGALAGALEARARDAGAEIDGATAVNLCEHYLASNRPQGAADYLGQALQHLEAGHLYGSVVELAKRALAVEGLARGKARFNALVRYEAGLRALGRPAEQEQVLDEACALADELGDATSLCRAQRGLGMFRQLGSKGEEAIAMFQGALENAHEADARRLVGALETNLGNTYTDLGRFDEARRHHERSLAVARELGDRGAESTCLGNIGTTYWAVGRYDEAQTHYESAIALAKEAGDLPGEGVYTGNLGLVVSAAGRHDEARALYERSLEIAQSLGLRASAASALGNLGAVFCSLGRMADEQEMYERSIEHCEATGYRSMEVVSRLNMGELLVRQGRYEDGERMLRETLALAREIRAREVAASALRACARTVEARGDLDEAERLYGEGCALYEELGVHNLHAANALLALGKLLAKRNRVDAARASLGAAHAMAVDAGYPAAEVLALGHLARLDPAGTPTAQEALTAHEDSMGPATKMEAHWVLWTLTQDRAHLARAHEYHEWILAHATLAARQSMLANVLLHQEIAQAWNAAP